jgi:glutamate 5-kinase
MSKVTAAQMVESPQSYKRIVLKLGTGLLSGSGGSLNTEAMATLTAQVAQLHHQNKDIIIVSSGAIAVGREKLGISDDARGLPFKQVLASIGQSRLMNIYEQLFSRHDIVTAQALLTKTDLADRAGYLNARNTLLSLLELRVLCVVNENDVVAVDEIEEAKFGDNDNLSAMVANLTDADLLLMLTDTAGLFTADPQKCKDACLIPEVARIDAEIERLATGTSNRLSTGGMITKIKAAKMATTSGITVIIADGRQPDVILRLAAGETIGTRFLPTSSKRESRKRWMVSGLGVKGTLSIDSGASQALKKQKRSLLATGIRQVSGDFQRGEIVAIGDDEDHKLGYGISNYNSSDINTIKGAHSNQIMNLLGHDYGAEVVHRNNLVIL